MAEVTEVVADVAEVVSEEAADVAEVARRLTSREARFLTLGIFGGLAVGGGAAYLVTNKLLSTKYQQYAEQEIDEMREHFQQRLVAKEEKPSLDEVVEDLGYTTPNPPKEVEPDAPLSTEDDSGEGEGDGVPGDGVVVVAEEATVTNIFEESQSDPDDGWNYEREVNKRDESRPYIIHYDEVGQHEDWDKVTFTYYADDDVLVDDREEIIPDIEGVVGELNLERFGHGSNDKNIVYIRNHKLEVEIEVLKHDGNYGEVVHGFVKHSDEPKHRRRHFDDD